MDRPLRIALVSDAVAPFHVGGKETRYQEIVRRLPADEVELTICTMRWWTGAAPAAEGGVRYRALCRRWPMYRADGRRSMVQALAFALGCLRLLRGRFDVIEADHMPGPQLLVLRLVAWIRGVPLQASWHEVWGLEYWKVYLEGPSARIAAAVERLSAHCPDRILANSTGTADRLVELLGVPVERVRLVENGLDLSALDTVEPAPSAELLYAGRLIDHKRVDVVLRAVRRLLDAGHELRLDVVGDGPERAALESLTASLELGDHVVFHGQLESIGEVWSRMAGARVFVTASEREGFGLSAVEAMASGTPVVAVDHVDNEARRFVRPGLGLLADPGDDADVARCIATLLDDRLTRESIRARFAAQFPQLSWDECAKGFLDACRNTVRDCELVPA